MSKHYDVAVLGAGIGALTTAALCARRSWRVLVVGQGWRPPTYQYDGVTLARRPFTFLAATSPAWGRVLVELAQSQTFRRRTVPLDPMFQVLAPKLRLEFPPDLQLFSKQVDRNYPEVRRVIDDLYAELARANAAADSAFEKDLVWPPGTFWERRETERIAGSIPRLTDPAPPLLAEFPREHEYRAIVDLPVRFCSHMVGAAEFAVARLHGSWTRGVMRLRGGEQELVDFLLERVSAHGGEIRTSSRVGRVVHKRGRVSAVVVDGDDAATGVEFVVTDHSARGLLDLAHDFDPPRRSLAALPRLIPVERRFVVSIVIREEALPSPLGDESFLVASGLRQGPLGSRPIVHLQRTRAPCGIDGATLLVAEAMFAEGTAGFASGGREVVLEAIETLLPFVERHYLVIDSPHDGRPLWDFRSGSRREIARASLRGTGGTLEAEPMMARWHVDPPSFHAIAGEPLRTPLGGAFVVGPSALPALGQEGELLAAWSVARLITRTDRQKERMRREMWSKIELG